MRLRPFLHLFSLLFFIQACSPSAQLITTSDIDPTGGLSREDYIALRERGGHARQETDEAADAPPIPPLPETETGPNKQGMSPLLNKRVSIDVSDSVPVREVLLELMRKTGANLELDPRVQGTVIIAAHNQPFGEVLQRICTMAGLRYTVDGAFIHVEMDEPYQKSYRLDYLSMARKTSSNTSIATNVFDTDIGQNGSQSGGTSGGNSNSTTAENNSTAKVASVSEADFWTETEKSVNQILSANERKNIKPSYSINKQAGIVTIYGDQKQQDAIARYFDELRRKSSAQVLIDARIVEVELDESYQAGIDWSLAFKNAVGIAANFGPQEAINTNGFFTAGITGSNLASMISLVQNFGTTRVLSAPRVTVLNNQTAVMKVATNQVYQISSGEIIPAP